MLDTISAYEVKELKTTIKDFIARNSRAVLQSKAWKELTNKDLMNDILMHVLMRNGLA
jgi:hypothetical protein